MRVRDAEDGCQSLGVCRRFSEPLRLYKGQLLNLVGIAIIVTTIVVGASTTVGVSTRGRRIAIPSRPGSSCSGRRRGALVVASVASAAAAAATTTAVIVTVAGTLVAIVTRVAIRSTAAIIVTLAAVASIVAVVVARATVATAIVVATTIASSSTTLFVAVPESASTTATTTAGKLYCIVSLERW
jgi:hypothetical protein